MKQIGRYEVEAELGRGAMGVVYLARDPRVRRPVALKTCRIPEGVDPKEEREFHQRFLREAQAAGALSHPGIVTIYDADEDPAQNIPFIAMEYVPGRSLKEVLRAEGRLSPRRALSMAMALADALHAAHQAGIVHRDIKPANILVRDGDGVVKIADFGVARFNASELTRSGSTLGSPAYMSPEQIRGGMVDGRSDLFSLAVILYEALCGERPFTGEDLSALVYAVAHETPCPVTRRVPGLPAGLDRFFETALAKDPAERFPDGDAFRRALYEAQRNGPGPEADGTLAEAEAAFAPAAAGIADTPGPSSASERPWNASVADFLEPGQTRRRHVASFRRRLRTWVTVACLVGAPAGGYWYWNTHYRACLLLEGRSTIEAGELTLLVDGREVYSRRLAAERKAVTAFGRKLFEHGQEEFGATLRVAPGRHEIVARVTREGEPTPQLDRTVVNLEAGEQRSLRLVAGRSLGSPLSLSSN